MPPKKNKGTKLDLSTFLTSGTTSWADEMDDIPIAPSIKDPSAPKRGDPDYFANVPNRGDRYGAAGGLDSRGPPREELPIPTKPPYTVFVGNLDFETGESDLMDYFGDIDAISAKIIKGVDDKPKGFGYVEFKTVDGLKAALERSGTQMLGRTVRVSVADAPKSGFGGGFGGAAEEASQWRRAGPLPPRSPPAGSRTPSSRYENREGGSGGFGPSAGLGGDVDWSAARGSKFAPSAPEPRGPGTFRDGPAFRDAPPREEGRSMAEMPDEWRSNRPARPPPPPAQERSFGSGSGPSRGPGFQERDAGLSGPAATEETWSRGSKFQAAPPKPAPIERGSPREAASPAISEGASDWRSTRKPSVAPDAPSSSPAPPAGPPARRALNLQPRSSTGTTAPSSAESTPSKPSPFGAAKAVDTSAREAEAIAKQQRLAEERKVAEKAAAETREKEKLEKIEKERLAKAEAAAAAPAVPATNANGPRNNSAGRGARGGPSNGTNVQNDRPPYQARKPSNEGRVHPSRLAQNQKSTTANSSNPPAAAEVDADGFVTAAGPGARRAPPTQASQNKSLADKEKEANARSGFSFATAARAGGLEGLVEDAADEDAGVAEGAKDAEASKQEESTEGITEGVKELSV